MACPNFKNGPKNDLRPLGVNGKIFMISWRDKDLYTREMAVETSDVKWSVDIFTFTI
jgi:hypothetical protein